MLQWLEKALEEGFIAPEAAHRVAELRLAPLGSPKKGFKLSTEAIMLAQEALVEATAGARLTPLQLSRRGPASRPSGAYSPPYPRA